MEFNLFICAAVYLVVAIGFVLADEADFGLIWLLFMPVVFVYLEATVGKSSTLSDSVLITVYDLLSAYFIPIMLWIMVFLVIYLWRNGVLEDWHSRLKDTIRPPGISGYTPEKFKDAMPMSAALMGTSTVNFAPKPLTLRDQAFIDLAVYALHSFGHQTNVLIVNQLRLPSDYYKSIHSRIAGRLECGSNSIPEMTRPFLREVSGNHDLPYRLLLDLCEVARMSGNTDQWTYLRLKKIAKHLSLSPEIVDQCL